MSRQGLPPDVLRKIAKMSDLDTQLILHRTSKLTKVQDLINALRKHAIAIAKKHFALYDISFAVINLSITHNGKPEKEGGRRLGFRSFDIEDSSITVLDSNEYPESSRGSSSSDEIDGGSPTNLRELTGFANEATQKLILHAAACYYVINHLDKIHSELTVSIPNKKGWANMATSILDMIVMEPSKRPRDAPWYVKFDIASITSEPLLHPQIQQVPPPVQRTSTRTQRQRIITTDDSLPTSAA